MTASREPTPGCSASRRQFIGASMGIALTTRLSGAVAGAEERSGSGGRQGIEEIRNDSDVASLLPQITNWGRWGKDDQISTLNFITPRRRCNAAKLVRSGRSVSLARLVPLAEEAGVVRGVHEIELRTGGCRDYLGRVFHGFSMTHLDGLCHIFAGDGQMYNGFPAAAVTAKGAAALGVETIAAHGITGRGILLDIAAVRGAPLTPGTAILGLPLLDNAELDELSRACREEQRWAFLFSLAPLRIPGATGSPVNPLALL